MHAGLFTKVSMEILKRPTVGSQLPARQLCKPITTKSQQFTKSQSYCPIPRKGFRVEVSVNTRWFVASQPHARSCALRLLRRSACGLATHKKILAAI